MSFNYYVVPSDIWLKISYEASGYAMLLVPSHLFSFRCKDFLLKSLFKHLKSTSIVFIVW
jgi:hypothetical protein